MKKQILGMLIFTVLVIVLISVVSCFVNQLKTVDDTEHLWIGKDGIEFYE
tara:strand:- start:362 stop:511 length:150 start_codon:yes stop_codon:yes gene_type:complete